MVKRYLVILLVLSLCVSGCEGQISKILPEKKEVTENLLKVEIFFTDDKVLVGHIKQLGIEQQNGKVYIGGSSLNYLYNQNGEIIGAYNYQRVLYMKILSEEEATH